MKYWLRKYAPIYFHVVIVHGFVKGIFDVCCNTNSLVDILQSLGYGLYSMVFGIYVWLWNHLESRISLSQVVVLYVVLLFVNGFVILIRLTSEELHDYLDEFLSVLWGVLLAHLSLAFMLMSSDSPHGDVFVTLLLFLLSNPFGVLATAMYVLLRYQQYPWTKRNVYLDYALAGFVTGFLFSLFSGTMAYLPMYSSLEHAILIHFSLLFISLAVWSLLKNKLSKVAQQAKDYFAIYHTQAASSDDIKARILSKD